MAKANINIPDPIWISLRNRKGGMFVLTNDLIKYTILRFVIEDYESENKTLITPENIKVLEDKFNELLKTKNQVR